MVCCVVHGNAVSLDYFVSSGLIHFLNISSTCSHLREADVSSLVKKSILGMLPSGLFDSIICLQTKRTPRMDSGIY